MPTISVDKAELYKRLEREYSASIRPPADRGHSRAESSPPLARLSLPFGPQLRPSLTSSASTLALSSMRTSVAFPRPRSLALALTRAVLLPLSCALPRLVRAPSQTTEEVARLRKAKLPTEDPVLKIEIPANRYDLLCLEGLSRALRIFLKLDSPPNYKLTTPATMLEVNVTKEVAQIRPFFAAAVLRFKEPFTEKSYKSFIDLQDKLHANLCRNRKFVAIGTHDLDTIEGPFL